MDDEAKLMETISNLSVVTLHALIEQLASKTQGIIDYQNLLTEIYERCLPHYYIDRDLTVGECLKRADKQKSESLTA